VFHKITTTYIFDLDGVVYLGNTPISGAPETITALQSAGKNVYFLTNNSGSTRADYRNKLLRMGVQTDEHHIVTSGYATGAYLAEQGAAGKNAFIIGMSGLATELQLAGLLPITEPDSVPFSEIDYCVLGIDYNFSYAKLRYAHTAIVRGHAQFIATNCDATFPMEEGEIPGCGSLVAALAMATSRKPLVIGKPEPHALQHVLKLAGCDPAEAVMVGDRLDTDIAAGNRCGVPSVLVMTGVTTPEMLAVHSKNEQPGTVIGSLSELIP
jgi:phosphoglycolate/pyridoxal phosphate phosphatase family enzyme